MFKPRLIGLISVLALAAFLPATAAGAEPDDEGASTIFAMKASKGYRLYVIGNAEKDDGQGEVVMYLVDKGQRDIAFYRVDGYVTDTRLKASFGALGGLNLVLRRSGKQGKYRARGGCDGRSESYEKARYEGILEFRGEEGFSYARATRIRVSPQPFVDLICSYQLEVNTSGLQGKRAGAALKAKMSRRRLGLELSVAKNRPGGQALVSAVVQEERHGIAIGRGIRRFAGPGAFEYGKSLSSARLRLPAPFSGSAVFRGGIRGARRWAGSLAVDFPGRAGVSLTRPGLRTRLVPALWSRHPPEFE